MNTKYVFWIICNSDWQQLQLFWNRIYNCMYECTVNGMCICVCGWACTSATMLPHAHAKLTAAWSFLLPWKQCMQCNLLRLQAQARACTYVYYCQVNLYICIFIHTGMPQTNLSRRKSAPRRSQTAANVQESRKCARVSSIFLFCVHRYTCICICKVDHRQLQMFMWAQCTMVLWGSRNVLLLMVACTCIRMQMHIRLIAVSRTRISRSTNLCARMHVSKFIDRYIQIQTHTCMCLQCRWAMKCCRL